MKYLSSKRNLVLVIVLSTSIFSFLLIGCGGTQKQTAQSPQPAQTQKTYNSVNNNVQILGYSLIKRTEKIPYGGGKFQIINNKISNTEQVLGPPETEAWAREGNQFVVLSVNINVQQEQEWIRILTSAQLVDQSGKSKYMDLWYFNGAYRPRTLLTWGLSGFNPGPHTKLVFQMKDPLPPKLKVKIQNKEMGFLEDM